MARLRSGLLSALVAASGIGGACTHAPTSGLPAPQIAAGQRVRVTTIRWFATRDVGNVTAVSGDSVVLRAGSRRLALPLDAVLKVEISRGRRGSHVLAGLGKGALIGTITGGLLGLASSVDCSGWGCGLALIVLPPVGAVIGATIGGVSGAVSHPEIWEPVPLDSLRRLRIGIVPQQRGRLGLGVSLSF